MRTHASMCAYAYMGERNPKPRTHAYAYKEERRGGKRQPTLWSIIPNKTHSLRRLVVTLLVYGHGIRARQRSCVRTRSGFKEKHTQNVEAKSCRISTRSPVISFMFNVSPPVSPAVHFQEDACVRKCVRVRDSVCVRERALKKKREGARATAASVCALGLPFSSAPRLSWYSFNTSTTCFRSVSIWVPVRARRDS